MSKIINLINEWGRIGDADRPALGEWLIDHESVTLKDRLGIPRDLEERDSMLKVIRALLLTTEVIFLGENREDFDTLCVELSAFAPGSIWHEVSQDGHCQPMARRQDGSCAGPFPFIDVKDPGCLRGVLPCDVGAVMYIGADADDYPLAHDIELRNEGAQIMYICPLSDMITVSESSCAMKRDLTEYFTDERCRAMMETMISGDGLFPEPPIATDAQKTIELDLDDDDIFSVVECDTGMGDDAFSSFMDDIESVVFAGADVRYVPGSYRLDGTTLTFHHSNGTNYTLSPSADGVLVEPEPPAGPDPLLNSRIQDYLRHSAWAELGSAGWSSWCLGAAQDPRYHRGSHPGTGCARPCKPEGRA